MWSGYAGEGTKTILPHVATAKVDSRLVPDQTPEAAMMLIREHLDARGFTDVKLERLAGYPPASTDLGAPLVQTAISVYNKHGRAHTVTPRSPASAPYHVFTDGLGLPFLAVGLGHGRAAHSRNELMLIEPNSPDGPAGLAEVEMFYVDLLYAIAEGARRRASGPP